MRNARRTGTRKKAGHALDLRQRTVADRSLQAEIDKALTTLREGLPLLVDLRLARVVSTILEPSWAEHASFQDDALFPLIDKAPSTTPELSALLARLGAEHDEIGERQIEIGRKLDRLILGYPSAAGGELERAVEDVLALRRHHHAAEAALVDLIPSPLDETDRAALDLWARERGEPPFPVNLILEHWE